MKNVFSKVIFITLIIGLILFAMTFTGCKGSDDSFDITDGTWGFFITGGEYSSGVVYAFQGSKTSGNVEYEGQVRGTYTLSGTTLRFTVEHYDSEDNTYIYSYEGIYTDYFNMAGTFSVTYPDGSVINGTWYAVR